MKTNSEKIILIGTTIIFIILEIYSLTTASHYKWDFFFVMLLLYAVYYLREKIRLHPLHYFLFALFLVMHNLGTFGTYGWKQGLWEYDLFVHSYFGFVSSLMLLRAYREVGPYRGYIKYIAVIALILGFSAFHELFEFAGALTVGEGEGVLFVGAGDLDEWDTQKDMFNNLWGGIIGILFYKIKDIFSSKRKRKH